MKTKKYKRKKKIIRKIVAGVAVVAFFGWFISLRINNEQSVGYDMVLAYEKHDLSTYVNASGTVVLSDSQTVSAEVTQKIKKLNFKVGDTVNEGDVLCEFDSEMLDEQIARYEKLINDAKTLEQLQDNNGANSQQYAKQLADISVESAKIALDAAQNEYDTAYSKYSEYYQIYYNSTDAAESDLYYNMYKQYEASLEPLSLQLQMAQNEYNSVLEQKTETLDQISESNYLKKFQSSEIEKYQETLDELKRQREHIVVTAPRSGVVTDCYVNEGSFTNEGELFKIGTLGDYKVEAVITDRDILNVKVGDEVYFTTVLTGDMEISGYIESISEYFNGFGYSATVKITDSDAMKLLKPNINTAVRVYTNKADELYSVAYDAIEQDENGNSYVLRAVENNGQFTAQKVEVQTGIESDFYVEIVSSDLKEGDLVVCGDKEHKAGDRIRLRGAD
ncbi:MAG: HlyD family efflux transporter periplasmic adaptor subunit [Ruminococcus sp.]|nr:HlyD family efflux transporter periplasmic adaptor subunit [Ruminococcus sp.]